MTETAGLRRTWLRGYRASDVEIALARSSLEQERLRLEVDAGRSRAQAMQTEIDHLHGRIDAFRSREAELDAAVAELREQRDALQQDARLRSDSIVADAERKAVDLRTESLREVTELQEQVEELLGLRGRLVRAFRNAGDQIAQTLDAIVDAVEPEVERESLLPDAPVEDLKDRLTRWRRDSAGDS
jgi:predicted  nucleic acid-binding Zn-ribbon protein